ncbi:MAG TPA: RodZ domain-containing protein [Gaiellales bacterium]|jgi:cytoskeletal protein RodZ
MFEIGPALREARERRGLGFGDVEAETAIRSRYIRALEEEQFHVLPGATYTKGFLRAYAEYLGLDGQLFIDEFNSRHHDARSSPEQQPIASRPRSRPQQRRQRRESNLVMIVLAAIVAVSALVLLATTFPNSPTAPYPNTTTPSTGPSTSTTPTTPAGGKTKHHKHASPERPRLTVSLVLGSSTWVRATTTAPNGPGAVTSKGTNLGHGLLVDPAVTGSSRVTFTARAPIFLRLGNPAAVTITVNGKAVKMPAGVTSKSVIRIVAAGDIRA